MSKKKSEKPKKDSKEQEYKEQLQRLQAEFENFRKRSEQQKTQFKELALAGFIQELLPTLDNIELALQHNKEPSDFSKGVELILAQLHELLERHNVKALPAEGAFDPHKHEAVLTESKEGAKTNTIIETLQKGYALNEKIIRTAKVKVAKGDA